MKPPHFEYRRPSTVPEALADLAAPGARVLAGGQSLLPLLNQRLVDVGRLVDVNRIAGLDRLTVDDDRLHVGATVRQATALRSPVVAAAAPLLVAALARTGHPQVRSRGTVLGSLCHHDPAAELPAVALALDAGIVVADGPTVPAAEFFGAAFETAVPAGGLAVAVTFPVAPPGTRAGFAEIGRKAKDLPLVAVGAQITVADGRIVAARVAATGLAAHPQRMTATEQALLGNPADGPAIAAAARAATGEIDPDLTLRASAGYRRRVLPAVVRRALDDALPTAGAVAA
ncbi:xanthine dehydrogenase family protein subunit M [Pseudonocardia kongjuensis]|uniref:Xanthine dehydrogenase family protein subunit M n=1 Tax=Pseudonocardia kongjuensis TaxID=102227 RepID=A0ABN1XF01_9PSEU